MNYILIGELELAEKYLNMLEQRSKTEYVAPTLLCWNYATREDMDKTYEYFKQAIEVRDSFLPWVFTIEEAVNFINANPRLKALTKEGGLEELL